MWRKGRRQRGHGGPCAERSCPGAPAKCQARRSCHSRPELSSGPVGCPFGQGREYRFCFVLPKGDNIFMRSLEAEISNHARHLESERVNADILYTDVFDPQALANTLVDLNGYDGIAVVALDHPRVREAIAGLCAQGIAVVTLVSDVPGSARSHFVGIDNSAAGRTAATLLGRYLNGRKGSIGIIAGSLSLRDHAERHFGFTQVMQQEYPSLKLLAVAEGRDSPRRNQSLVSDMISSNSSLIGLYNLGAGRRASSQRSHRQAAPLTLSSPPTSSILSPARGCWTAASTLSSHKIPATKSAPPCAC